MWCWLATGLLLAGAAGAVEPGAGRGIAERVAFIRRPGVREPMDCWERMPGEATVWREVAPGTGEYLLEMSVLMRVLAAHRAAQATPSQ
jgi:hypothetical protein